MRALALGMAVMIWATVAVGADQEAAWLEFGPAVVSLTGRFELVLRFGPPNYGEDPKTDMKIQVPMLWLAEPIRVRGRPGDEIDGEPVEGIRVLQLHLPIDIERNALLGEEVVVRGELTHAMQGPEFTPVVMRVQEIGPAR